ncbi:hypothetical protein N7451_002771 [Penicillium sp. IBT 35674x]|nr:hypothetical protein N7451_002771 [Penicillium sp. IBT 35674x]
MGRVVVDIQQEAEKRQIWAIQPFHPNLEVLVDLECCNPRITFLAARFAVRVYRRGLQWSSWALKQARTPPKQREERDSVAPRRIVVLVALLWVDTRTILGLTN